MKTLRKSGFECWDRNQLQLCRKSYWNKQPFIFTGYLMNHVFQTSVQLQTTSDNSRQLNWLYNHMKKRQKQPTLYFNQFLYWIQHKFCHMSILKLIFFWRALLFLRLSCTKKTVDYYMNKYYMQSCLWFHLLPKIPIKARKTANVSGIVIYLNRFALKFIAVL